MISPAVEPVSATSEQVLRVARRAWFWAGVRRGDRRLLCQELTDELAAAQGHVTPADVLGPNPRQAAVEWARARDFTDRRLRLAVFVLPALVVGVVAAGAVLAVLADAFAGDGQTVLGDPSPSVILGFYAGSALLAAGGMVTATGLILHAFGDVTTMLTVKLLAAVLPIGGLVAAGIGIAIAQALDFSTRPRTFVCTTLAVVITLALTLATARLYAVRLQARREPVHLES